jgi:hypothetical protein
MKTIKSKSIATAAALLLLATHPGSTARAQIYGTNLVLDAGAENETGSPTGDDVIPLLDWSIYGVDHFTVVQYGDASGVSFTCPGPTNRGANYFYGGPDNAFSFAYQWVDVSSVAADIDGHNVVCNLSGWLGGWASQDDNARFTAYFVNAADQTIRSLQIGPVLAADRTNITGMLYRQASARLPAGTRHIRYELDMTRMFGGYNDGIADNLALVISNSPPLPVPLDTNLLANPGGELGPGSLSGNDAESVPGWATSGGLTVAVYGPGSGIFTNSPGPADRGTNFFAGGYQSGTTWATQDFDLYSRSADIDAGNLACNLSGWFGGWLAYDDNARLTAYFIDDFGQTTGSLTAGPVLAADRTNVSGLFLRGAATNIPPGTRTIHCVLLMTPTFSTYNNGFADNLSLTLASTTAPRLASAIGGNSATFSWPLSAGDWTLQSATNLAANPIAWADAPLPYQTNGATVSLTFSNFTTAPAQFFRLRK